MFLSTENKYNNVKMQLCVYYSISKNTTLKSKPYNKALLCHAYKIDVLNVQDFQKLYAKQSNFSELPLYINILIHNQLFDFKTYIKIILNNSRNQKGNSNLHMIMKTDINDFVHAISVLNRYKFCLAGKVLKHRIF